MLTLSFSVAGLAMCIPSMARDLRLDYAEQGLVMSAPMWSFALSLAVAALADRVALRGLLLVASLMQAVGWFVLAEVRSFPQALLAAVLVGIGGSILDPLLTPIICAVYPERRVRMANLLHGFYCVGLVSVALGVVFVHPAALSWRWVFRILGLLCLPYGVASAVLALPGQVHSGPVRLKTRRLIARPAFWVLALGMVLAAGTELGPANWLPSFVLSLAGPDDSAAGRNLGAGVGLALFGALMAAGRFTTSAMEGRLSTRPLMASAAIVCAVCLAAVALPLGTAFRIVCLGIVGFAVACFWPTLLAVAGNRFPEAGASMFSVLSAVGAIGCAAGPAAVGWMGSAFGDLAPAIAALALAPALLLVTTTCLDGARPGPGET
jgi:fucose permease